MRFVIALAITGLLITHKSFSQNEDNLYKGFAVAISFEPNYSYRQLSYGSDYDFLKKLRNNRELPKFGFSTGLNVRYDLKRRFSLETGLIFTDTGMKTRAEYLSWHKPKKDYPIKSKTRISFYFIELPLKVNYHFKLGNLRGYTISGISFNTFISRNTTLIVQHENGEKDKTNSTSDYGYKPNSYSYLIGVGLDIPLSDRFLLNIEPIYRRDFTSISYDKNAREYFYSFGLNTKLFYRLKKKMK